MYACFRYKPNTANRQLPTKRWENTNIKYQPIQKRKEPTLNHSIFLQPIGITFEQKKNYGAKFQPNPPAKTYQYITHRIFNMNEKHNSEITIIQKRKKQQQIKNNAKKTRIAHHYRRFLSPTFPVSCSNTRKHDSLILWNTLSILFHLSPLVCRSKEEHTYTFIYHIISYHIWYHMIYNGIKLYRILCIIGWSVNSSFYSSSSFLWWFTVLLEPRVSGVAAHDYVKIGVHKMLVACISIYLSISISPLSMQKTTESAVCMPTEQVSNRRFISFLSNAQQQK